MTDLKFPDLYELFIHDFKMYSHQNQKKEEKKVDLKIRHLKFSKIFRNLSLFSSLKSGNLMFIRPRTPRFHEYLLIYPTNPIARSSFLFILFFFLKNKN